MDTPVGIIIDPLQGSLLNNQDSMDFVSGRFFHSLRLKILEKRHTLWAVGITDNRVVVGHPVLKKTYCKYLGVMQGSWNYHFFFETGIKVDANVWVIFEGFPSKIGHCLGWFHTILVVVSISFIFTREMIQFDQYFSCGLLQPPTRISNEYLPRTQMTPYFGRFDP